MTRTENGRARDLERKGIEFIRYENRLHLKDLMAILGKMGITSVMIEGGSRLAFHALNDGVVDKVMYFIAPKIIGGRECYPAVGGDSFREIEDAIVLKNVTVKKTGGDILVEGYVRSSFSDEPGAGITGSTAGKRNPERSSPGRTLE